MTDPLNSAPGLSVADELRQAAAYWLGDADPDDPGINSPGSVAKLFRTQAELEHPREIVVNMARAVNAGHARDEATQ